MDQNCRPNNLYRGYLSKPILYPLFFVFFLFGGSFIAIFSWDLYKSIDHESANQIRALEGILESDIQSDIHHMTVLLDDIKFIPGLKEAFKNRDRENLFKLANSFYRRVNQHLYVTHFYFSDADRVNLLRVHNPSRYGDRIDRYTTLQAEKSGNISYGMELGVMGSFTLRVVLPWYENGALIGFIEIGEEIDHITQKLRDRLNAELQIFIYKKMLAKDDWQSEMKMLQRDGNWDRFPKHVYIPSDAEQNAPFAKEVNRLLLAPTTLVEGDILDFNTPQKYIKAAFMPLFDVQKNKVGNLLISIDATRWQDNLYFSIIITIAIAILANTLLVVLFMRLARRAENKLDQTHQQLADEADVRDRLQEIHIEELEAKNRALELSQSRLGESEGQLQKTQQLTHHLGNVLDNSSNEIIIIDADSKTILRINNTALQHLNYSEAEIHNINIFDILVGLDEDQLNRCTASLDSRQSHEVQIEAQFIPKDSLPYHVELRIQKSQYESNPVFIVQALDISEKFAQQQALVHQGLHDPLTELPNRMQLTKLIQEVITNAQDANSAVVLVLININRFQEINDTIGHNNGDQILLQYARRIQSIMSKQGTLFHIGGDNFAILLSNFSSANINAFIYRIDSILQRPFSVASYNLTIDSSFGVAAFPKHAHNEIQLMQFAEIALKRSKEQLSGFEIYDPNLDPFSLKRLMITSHMRHAIERNEFSIYYQPKVRSEGASPHSAEALIRWQHPEHGFISPEQFIILAEKTGYIREITQWVINETFEQMAEWKKEGIKIPISINISAHNLLDPNFIHCIDELSSKWNVRCSTVTLEVTETAVMMDPEYTISVLNQMSEKGYKIALDDYGTGYSTLSYLKQLPADELKIDSSFIRNMLDDDDSYTIVYSTIELAHNLGMSVTAEGVENLELSEQLHDLGCELQQGYFFSKPLPADEFVAWQQNN